MFALFLFLGIFPQQMNGELEDIYEKAVYKEPIRFKACQGLPYNVTIFPNGQGQSTQKEAADGIATFSPLLKSACSSSLKLFLCSLYFPVATELNRPLPPCRPLCEQNRRDCITLVKKFDQEWPEKLNCSQFPESGLCISENITEKQEPVEPSFICPTHLRVPPRYGFKVRMKSGQFIHDCGISCRDFPFGDPNSRSFSRLWIGLWSCLCAASTLFTVLTFLIDIPRFQYPERSIIFLSACYLMVALTYVVGFILNNKVACSGPFQHPPPLPALVNQIQMPRMITQGTKFEGCIILFMFLYFFSMASSIWWVILTITWYLAAKCHWAHEAISRNAQYLHFAAWAIPAAKTIGILALGKVDGDPLSGVCFTGLTDPVILRIFLIAPLSVYLIIGTCFLFAGFVSLFKIRTIIKTGGSKTDDLEKLIMRIGVFSLLYIVPAIVVIGCYIHESRMADKWMLTWYFTEVCNKDPSSQMSSRICSSVFQRLINSEDHLTKLAEKLDYHNIMTKNEDLLNKISIAKPEFELSMIKYLMTLIVGITSGIWIWSEKTLISWQRFFANRLCYCHKNRPTINHPTAAGTAPYMVGARRALPGAPVANASLNPNSVPLLQRTPHHANVPTLPGGQPLFSSFNPDTGNAPGGWTTSRGAPSGITSSPPDNSTPVGSYATTGWINGSTNQNAGVAN